MAASTQPNGTYLIHQKLKHGLLLDINEILTKDLLTGGFLFSVKAGLEGLDGGPGGIRPSITQDEFVLSGMVTEPDIAIVEHLESV